MMKKTTLGKDRFRNGGALMGVALMILMGLTWGCMTTTSKQLKLKDTALTFSTDAIVDLDKRQTLSYEDLSDVLEKARVIYVGENHTDSQHHQIQLKVIKTMFERHPDLTVGMEMFDHTYQEILDQWSAGELDRDLFLQKTHWYANWRYPFSLYQDILEFIKAKHIPLIGLNIPFHLPPKISIGGVDSLSADEKKHLPQKIDTTNAAHRAYVEKIFKQHRIPGRTDFEYFYAAQCVWEDAMAEAIQRHLGQGPMIVLIGNGHIIHKFGVPDRAYRRTQAPFKTVYLAPAGAEIEPTTADFVWVTPPRPRRAHPFIK